MEKKKIFTRYTAITLILTVMFLILSFRLADIQIVQGEEYRTLAQDKSIRSIDDDAPRGEILDRNGIKLATNIQSYTIFMMKPQDKQEEKNLMLVIERLVDILNSNNEKIKDDFPIIISDVKDPNGQYIMEFDFPNNYEDPEERQGYINRAAAKWKKDNGIKEAEGVSYTAAETFEILKEKYEISLEREEHNNVPFIRQMLAVRQLIKDMGYMAYKPVEIAYVSRQTAFEIMEKAMYLPGVDYKIKPLRTYPFGELAATVIGSLRKIPGDKAEEYKDKFYDISTDLIGRDGIEAYAQEDLRGEKGGRTVRVDAYGRIVEELGKRDPVPGNNIVLTLDKDLQEFAENTLDNVMQQLRDHTLVPKTKAARPNATRGAAVVIDIKTGEVLAMASRPGGYDPNVMAATGSFSTEVGKILYPQSEDYPGVDPERILSPMFNYATRGAAPPGSTYKMISAIAGLETGEITPDTKINDVGQYRVVKSFGGNCWIWNYYHRSHGWLNVVGALQKSCNYFFYDVGNRVGLENLAKYSAMFGLSDEPTGIEIFEVPGDSANIPDIKARAEGYAIRSTLKEICTPDYDPKFGTFNPTDDQENVIKEVIKNNNQEKSTILSEKLKAAGISSYKIRRRILDAALDVKNEYTKPGLPLNAAIGQGENVFTPLQIANYIATIANGGTRYRPHLIKSIVKPDGTVVDVQPDVMEHIELKSSTLPTVIAGMDAVTSEGGTAGSVFKSISVKTAGKTGTAQAPGGRDDYSWFAGFAPVDDPQIAIAVVIHEGGGDGSSNVARDIIEYYFNNMNNNPATGE